MKYLLSWIREYAPVDKTHQEISAILMDLGMNLEASEVLADDVALELEITANRPDALSHLGIAREVAAHCGVPLRKPEFLELPIRSSAGPGLSGISGASIQVLDPALCPRYCGLVVEDVKIGPSPEWFSKRLERVGIRPINIMVDITNYVLAAVGHPLHAFDLDLLADHTIVVRKAAAGEKMKTLDGVDRAFRGDELLICDGRHPVAVAGVMGGMETEIHPGTRRVLLESAYFNPDSVRRTSRFLGLNSEASQRFGRGADPLMPPAALMMAAHLIKDLGCGTVKAPILDVHPNPYTPREILLRRDAMKTFFEFEFDRTFLADTFRALECKVQDRGEDLCVVPPSFRSDLREEVDLYEEAARFYGYNNLPARMPEVVTGRAWELPHLNLVRAAQDALAGMGLMEVYSYAFASPAELETFESSAPGDPVEIANPLNVEEPAMRVSMAPGLIRTLQANARKGQDQCALFEVGKVYYQKDGAYGEDLRAGILLSCPDGKSERGESPSMRMFRRLKGMLENLFQQLRGRGIRFKPCRLKGFAASGAAEIHLDGRRIGFMGQAAVEDLKHPAWVADIALEPFLPVFQQPVRYQAESNFPAVRLDLTVIHKSDFSWEDLVAAVRSAGLDFLEEIQFKYVYVKDGEVRTTLSLVFQTRERSLTQEEVNAQRGRLVDHLERLYPLHI